MTTAVREAAPAVLATALATAALFLPAAVMGDGPGLELLHSFAIALLAALVTSAALVLFVVPGLYPALAGLSPLPIPPDVPDQPDPGRHAGEDPARSDAVRSDAAPALSHHEREEQR
jgi:hypothetical protein